MMKSLLLQCKFLIVAFLNISYNIIPNPFRNWYFRLFGIFIGNGSCIHRGCKFFHIGKLSIGKNSVVNFGCYLDNRRGIIIGENVGLAHNVKIYTLGHNIDSPNFETKGKSVIIEDGVFVFSNAIITIRIFDSIFHYIQIARVVNLYRSIIGYNLFRRLD